MRNWLASLSVGLIKKDVGEKHVYVDFDVNSLAYITGYKVDQGLESGALVDAANPTSHQASTTSDVMPQDAKPIYLVFKMKGPMAVSVRKPIPELLRIQSSGSVSKYTF